jgi:alpha-galactosidase
MKGLYKMHLLFTSLLFTLFAVGSSMAQTGQVIRLDGGNSTYAFGVNERGELQPLYWGGRLGAHDSISAAHSFPEMASFDSPATTTPQEYAGWGAGLFTEPALKVSFPDGNRDLVLHFVRVVSNNSNSAEILLKDISREIYVTLRYSMDQESGILARSANIENREKQPIMIEQAAFIRRIRGLRFRGKMAGTPPPLRTKSMEKSGLARWRGRVPGGSR